MGDRNINVRSITGLNPVQDIMCDRLDIVRKITIDGSEPVTIQFLGYDPATQTTKYKPQQEQQQGEEERERELNHRHHQSLVILLLDLSLIYHFFHLLIHQRLLQHFHHLERLERLERLWQLKKGLPF